MRKFWGCFYYVIEKFIDRLETKMTDVDPSIVGQHVRPLENNYFKENMSVFREFDKENAQHDLQFKSLCNNFNI